MVGRRTCSAGGAASGRPARLRALLVRRSAAACAPSAVLRRRSVMGGPWPLLARALASGSPARLSSTMRFPPSAVDPGQLHLLWECGSRPRELPARACAAEAEGWGPYWTARSRPGRSACDEQGGLAVRLVQR